MSFWDTVGRVGADVATGGLYEVGRAGYNALVKPGQQAAQNAAQNQQRLSQQAFGMAPQLQGQAENYGAQAQQYYNSANSAYYNLFNNQINPYTGQPYGGLAQQGMGEQAFNNYGSGLTGGNATVNSQNYYNMAAPQLTSSSASESFYNPSNYFQPTSSGTAYNSMLGSGTFSTNPMSEAYGGLSAQLSQPSNSQSQLGYLTSSLSGPTSLQNNYGNLVGQIGSSDRLTANLGRLQGQGAQALGSSMATTGALMGQEAGPGVTSRNYNMLSGVYGNDTYSQQAYGQQRPELSNPGMYEDFVSRALAGPQFDPTYQRESELGSAALDQEMNARGGYNSGAALKALGNFQGDLRAQQYSQLANMAQGAQSAEMQRLGQQMGAAGQASGELMGQGQALQGLSGQTEAEIQGRIAAQNQMGQQEFQNQNTYTNMMAGLYGSSDAESLANAQAIAGLNTTMDANQLARMQAIGGLGNAADVANMARLTEQGNLANMSANQRLALLQQQGVMANQADTQYNQLLQSGANAAQNASSALVNRLQQGGVLANNIDTNNITALNNYLSQAGNMQQNQQNRLQTSLTDALALGGAQSAITTGQGDVGLQAYINMIENGMGLSGNAASLNAQAAQMPMQDILALLGIGVQGYSAYQGGRKA